MLAIATKFNSSEPDPFEKNLEHKIAAKGTWVVEGLKCEPRKSIVHSLNA